MAVEEYSTFIANSDDISVWEHVFSLSICTVDLCCVVLQANVAQFLNDVPNLLPLCCRMSLQTRFVTRRTCAWVGGPLPYPFGPPRLPTHNAALWISLSQLSRCHTMHFVKWLHTLVTTAQLKETPCTTIKISWTMEKKEWVYGHFRPRPCRRALTVEIAHLSIQLAQGHGGCSLSP